MTLSLGPKGKEETIQTCKEGAEFSKNTKVHHVPTTIPHWQLRDLLCSPKNSQLYHTHRRSIYQYHTKTGAHLPVFHNLSFEPTSLSSGCGYIAAGGQRSQLVVKSLEGEWFGERTVGGSINNALDISHHSGETRLLVSNNDETIKVFSLPSLELHSTIRLTTPVNYASVSPDGKTMVAVGDSEKVFLYDIRQGYHQTHVLKGSSDASFSCSWNRFSDQFAVASQDGYVSVWDLRSTKRLARLGAKQMISNVSLTGACRNVKFSPCGSLDLLVFTEHTNYAHVVDARTFEEQQIIKIPETTEVALATYSTASPGCDLSGLCFSPDGNNFYISTTEAIFEFSVDSVSRRTFPLASFI